MWTSHSSEPRKKVRQERGGKPTSEARFLKVYVWRPLAKYNAK